MNSSARQLPLDVTRPFEHPITHFKPHPSFSKPYLDHNSPSQLLLRLGRLYFRLCRFRRAGTGDKGSLSKRDRRRHPYFRCHQRRLSSQQQQWRLLTTPCYRQLLVVCRRHCCKEILCDSVMKGEKGRCACSEYW